MTTQKVQQLMTTETVDRQKNYVAAQKEKGNGLGIVFADAFLRGMRDIGYKNPAWALSEESDNSFQAQADILSIRFKPDATEPSKPEQIAVIDNGNGMIPEMISFAVRWGGTDREGDRHGYGRYGYGLPSSAVSVSQRYSVYSKVKNGEWYAVTVDLAELAAAASDLAKTEKLLEAKSAALPKWIIKTENNLDFSTLDSGTVIVLEDLDRLRAMSGWMKIDTIKTKFLQHFGVIYRHKIPSDYRIFVDGAQAEAVDPLFLMEHGRFYDETSVMAEKVETRTFEVETSRGTIGKVYIRASVLPQNFQLKNPDEYGRKKADNKRFDIMKNYHGLLICREWRQIDTISPWWTKFQNEDLNINIEINFDAELDEFFGITTSKQQIVIEESMREKLLHSGRGGGDLINLVKDLRGRFLELQKELKAKYSKPEGNGKPSASVAAMMDSEKFKGSTYELTPDQKEEAQKNLEQAASDRVRVTGESHETAIAEILDATKKEPWDFNFQSIPEGPFYRTRRLGTQKSMVINTDHPFYSKLYETAAPEVKSALEVMLFVLAERELESTGDALAFYRSERQKWSERLRHSLDSLISDESVTDQANATAERLVNTLSEG